MDHPESTATIAIFDHQEARKVAARLEAAGRTIVFLPSAVAETIENGAQTGRILASLATLDWLLFADPFSVDHFFEVAAAAGVATGDLDEKQICSVGEAAAARLRERFIHSDIIAQSSRVTAALEAIAAYSSLPDGQRILVLHRRSDMDQFDPAAYKDLFIDCLDVYRLNFEAGKGKLQGLLIGGAIDAVVAVSPPDLLSLKALLEPHDPVTALAGIEAYASNSDSLQALFEYGFKPRLLQR